MCFSCASPFCKLYAWFNHLYRALHSFGYMFFNPLYICHNWNVFWLFTDRFVWEISNTLLHNMCIIPFKTGEKNTYIYTCIIYIKYVSIYNIYSQVFFFIYGNHIYSPSSKLICIVKNMSYTIYEFRLLQRSGLCW